MRKFSDMTKGDLNRIRDFINQIEQLPNQILTDEEAKIFMNESNPVEKQKIYDHQKELFSIVTELKIGLHAFFKAVFGDQSTHLAQLSELTFRTKNFIANTLHYSNNDAWNEDRSKLILLLKLAERECIEQMRVDRENNTFSKIINSSQFKYFILTAIVGALLAIFLPKDMIKKSGTNPESTNKIEKADTVKSTSLDSQQVVIDTPFISPKIQMPK